MFQIYRQDKGFETKLIILTGTKERKQDSL